MDIEEIKAQVINSVQCKINDNTLSIIDKWKFIEMAYHLIGHYKSHIESETLQDGTICGYGGGKEEFEHLKSIVYEK